MEITLNSNGWHRRLQRFVFNNPPRFNNFCPYFWLTNFCILVTFIIPIVPLVKLILLIVKGFVWFIEKSTDWFDQKICEPLVRQAARIMGEDDIMKAWVVNYNHEWTRGSNSEADWEYYHFMRDEYFLDKDGKDPIYGTKEYKKKAMRKKFDLWKQDNPDWELKLKEMRQKIKDSWLKAAEDRKKLQEELALKEKQEWEAREVAKKRTQQMFTNIVKYTKWIGYIIAIALLIIIAYGVWLVIDYAWAHFYPDKLWRFLRNAGIILVFVGIIVLIVWMFARIFTKCAVCICNSWFGRTFGKAAVAFAKFFIVIGSGLGQFFKFFWQYIMTVKENYCPGIQWKENKTT
jgi:hypothetical protein